VQPAHTSDDFEGSGCRSRAPGAPVRHVRDAPATECGWGARRPARRARRQPTAPASARPGPDL